MRPVSLSFHPLTLTSTSGNQIDFIPNGCSFSFAISRSPCRCSFLFFVHVARLFIPIASALLFVGTRVAFSLNYTYSDCVKWYIFQEVGTQALIAAVEFILIVRGPLSLHFPYRRRAHSSKFTLCMTEAASSLRFSSSSTSWRMSS